MRSTSRIGVFPAWEDNPYLNYLYLAARARGHEILSATTFRSGVALLDRLGDGDVFHLHWTAPVVQRADTADEAVERLERFRLAVDEARARGVLVVWTIHNVLPHDARHLETEVALCQMIADRADLVHVLSPATAEMTAPHYVLPADRIVRIPHPSYQGVYANSSRRDAARAAMGIRPEDRAVLFFGQMRPYKGLTELFDAIGGLDADEASRTVLLLAGRTRDEDLPAVEEHLPTNVRVVRDHSFIADEDVDRWFRAADVAVYPYRAILNSGSLHLAATFGVRALLPAEAHLVEEFDGEDWIRFYESADPVSGIRDALLDPASYSPVETSAAFSRRLSPWNVSQRFADALDDALAQRAAAREATLAGEGTTPDDALVERSAAAG